MNAILALILSATITMPTPTWLTPAFTQQVAARCSGEYHLAVHECACSVRNRINAGWNPAKVLNAYFAPDVTPTEPAITQAESGLKGENCNPDAYYMMSATDSTYLRWDTATAVLAVTEASGRGVYFYPRKKWGTTDK